MPVFEVQKKCQIRTGERERTGSEMFSREDLRFSANAREKSNFCGGMALAFPGGTKTT